MSCYCPSPETHTASSKVRTVDWGFLFDSAQCKPSLGIVLISCRFSRVDLSLDGGHSEVKSFERFVSKCHSFDECLGAASRKCLSCLHKLSQLHCLGQSCWNPWLCPIRFVRFRAFCKWGMSHQVIERDRHASSRCLRSSPLSPVYLAWGTLWIFR